MKARSFTPARDCSPATASNKKDNRTPQTETQVLTPYTTPCTLRSSIDSISGKPLPSRQYTPIAIKLDATDTKPIKSHQPEKTVLPTMKNSELPRRSCTLVVKDHEDLHPPTPNYSTSPANVSDNTSKLQSSQPVRTFQTDASGHVNAKFNNEAYLDKQLVVNSSYTTTSVCDASDSTDGILFGSPTAFQVSQAAEFIDKYNVQKGGMIDVSQVATQMSALDTNFSVPVSFTGVASVDTCDSDAKSEVPQYPPVVQSTDGVSDASSDIEGLEEDSQCLALLAHSFSDSDDEKEPEGCADGADSKGDIGLKSAELAVKPDSQEGLDNLLASSSIQIDMDASINSEDLLMDLLDDDSDLSVSSNHCDNPAAPAAKVSKNLNQKDSTAPDITNHEDGDDDDAILLEALDDLSDT
eukprot:Filipodium_phascolosomae@DN2327_c0_g1_i1.p1